MSWVCALCNLCILLTRELDTPATTLAKWIQYRDMLGVINQPNAKQMWKLMCLYNLNELYFVTFLEKQILQIKYLEEICVTTIIFICVPLSMFSIILSTSTSIYSWVPWYFGLNFFYVLYWDIFHNSLFNALSTTIALPNMTNDKELPEYYDLKVCWHVIL